MLHEIGKYCKKPKLYEKSTNKFWDDEHISKGMLEAHLSANTDGATRNHTFVKASVDWISAIAPPEKYQTLLDLGCGPGIYAELFTHKGYTVTGVDFSKRSIDYAVQQAKEKKLAITYSYENYLEAVFTQQFDCITLIWCDYGALSDADRAILLSKVYTALKPKGVFILDVFTDVKYAELTEHTQYAFFAHGGFWSEKQHLCLDASYLYDNQIALRQAIVATDETVACHNIWEHYFTTSKLVLELEKAGLKAESFYSTIAGKEYDKESETLCIVAKKH